MSVLNPRVFVAPLLMLPVYAPIIFVVLVINEKKNEKKKLIKIGKNKEKIFLRKSF